MQPRTIAISGSIERKGPRNDTKVYGARPSNRPLPQWVKLRRTHNEQLSAGVALKADIARYSRDVSKVPTTDIIDSAALRRFGHVNSLYEEPFFSCRQGGGSPPPAATGSPSPIRAVSEQHLHAVLSLVRRTGRRSSVPLASRPSWAIPNQCWPEAFTDGLLSRWSGLSHSCHLKLCIFGKLFQILILLPFLHSPRRFFSRG